MVRRQYVAIARSATNTGILLRIISNQWRTSVGERIFLSFRLLLTPYDKMLSFVPKSGAVLDLGCGHGLFSLFAALESSQRTVSGIDHDKDRIAGANLAATDVTNLRFAVGDIRETSKWPKVQCILFIDILVYFRRHVQKELLIAANTALKPGGTLVLRVVDPSPSLASCINRLYLWFNRIFTPNGRLTRKKTPEVVLPRIEEWLSVLRGIGLEARAEKCSSIFFADVLIVGRKPSTT